MLFNMQVYCDMVTDGGGLWSLICVKIRLSSYDDNQIFRLSVYNGFQHAAFNVVLNFQSLVCMLAVTFNLFVRILLLIPSLAINFHFGIVSSHFKKDRMLTTELYLVVSI